MMESCEFVMVVLLEACKLKAILKRIYEVLRHLGGTAAPPRVLWVFVSEERKRNKCHTAGIRSSQIPSTAAKQEQYRLCLAGRGKKWKAKMHGCPGGEGDSAGTGVF
jgi:hypothetical protein